MVIDPAGDAPPAQLDIFVEGGRIAAIGPNLPLPRHARRVDATGAYLVPGLWDAHAHLNALTDVGAAPELYVGNGVLHVRDMGGEMSALVALRDVVRSGARVGPEIFIAGPTLNGQRSAPFHRVVSSEDEACATVRELAEAGVDFIKVHRRLSVAVLAIVIDEARLRGLDVYGHVPLGLSWVEASARGLRSIEHVFTILENEMADPHDPSESIEAALARIDGVRGDTVFAAMARAQTHLCPTLVAFERSIPDPPELADAKRQGLRHFLSYVARAHRAGVPILAGSDVATDPGASLLRELELLVEAGLSPREALRTATVVPATLLHREELGRLRPGAEASFLILGSDPTLDITALRDLDGVVLRGRVFSGAELALLRALEAPTEN
jgi:imidazolonepropionase-like amidohydrolase